MIPDLRKEKSTNVVIVLALEEQNLQNLHCEDTFPLLVTTLERVMLVNLQTVFNFNLVAVPMVYSIGEANKPLQARVAAHNVSVSAFNYNMRGVCTLEICSRPQPPTRMVLD